MARPLLSRLSNDLDWAISERPSVETTQAITNFFITLLVERLMTTLQLVCGKTGFPTPLQEDGWFLQDRSAEFMLPLRERLIVRNRVAVKHHDNEAADERDGGHAE